MDRDLISVVNSRYGVTGDAAEPMVGGGDECELWRLNSTPPVVIRVSPAWRTGLAWTHDVAARLAASVPEVTCPLVANDGTTVFDWQGRPVSVWPFVDSVPLDRNTAAARTQAADLLARLHSAGMGDRRPRSQPKPIGTASLLPDPALDAWLLDWERRPDEPEGLVHGDFYRRNLLYRDGRIVGLIDWDDARHDRLVTELAWSVWEFAKSADGTTLLPDRARSFLTDYRNAGGPIAPSGTLLPLIRAHLRYEVDRAEQARNTGGFMDPDYQAAEIAAFHTLVEFSL